MVIKLHWINTVGHAFYFSLLVVVRMVERILDTISVNDDTMGSVEITIYGELTGVDSKWSNIGFNLGFNLGSDVWSDVWSIEWFNVGFNESRMDAWFFKYSGYTTFSK